jgi:UDP-N-acetyl-D-glucosamine dehydrogenase
LGKIRNHPGLSGLKSIPLTAESISAYDAILLVTDHDDLDYGLMAKHARLVIDTRNAFGARKITNPNIVKA